MRLLVDLDCGFDVASSGEMEKTIKLGVDSDKIIYANTVKSEYDIKNSKKHRVRMMTFDSVNELEKIARIFQEAHIILRI